MNLIEYLNSAAEEDVKQITDLFVTGKKFATKEFITSLSHKLNYDVNKLTFEIEYLATSYERFIRSGRRPGSKLPPKIAIENYLKAKGIPAQFTFQAQRAIAEQGIKPFDFVEYVFTDQRINELSKGISEILQKQISEKIITSIK